jgi:hypothetical protein
MILLLSLIIIAQLTYAEIWSATTTNCLWYEHTTNDYLNKRIDLRDIRNQLLT